MLENWLKELTLWNGAHNLMAAEEMDNLEEHCADSLSLVPFLEEAFLALCPSRDASDRGRDKDETPLQNRNRLPSPPALPRESGGLRIVDIGSGGGFPVIPLALWAKENQKNWRFTATDVSDKKIAFLKWSRSKFALPMDVVKVDKGFRVEEPCIVTSRAFSEVRGILRWTRAHAPHCQSWLLLKGAKAEAELSAARVTAYELFPNPRGVIVRFGAAHG